MKYAGCNQFVSLCKVWLTVFVGVDMQLLCSLGAAVHALLVIRHCTWWNLQSEHLKYIPKMLPMKVVNSHGGAAAAAAVLSSSPGITRPPVLLYSLACMP